MVFSSHMTQRAGARRVVGIRLYVLCRKLFFLRGPVQLGGAVHPSDRDEKAFRLLPITGGNDRPQTQPCARGKKTRTGAL